MRKKDRKHIYFKLKTKPKLYKKEQNVPLFTATPLGFPAPPPQPEWAHSIHMGELWCENDSILSDFVAGQDLTSE